MLDLHSGPISKDLGLAHYLRWFADNLALVHFLAQRSGATWNPPNRPLNSLTRARVVVVIGARICIYMLPNAREGSWPMSILMDRQLRRPIRYATFDKIHHSVLAQVPILAQTSLALGSSSCELTCSHQNLADAVSAFLVLSFCCLRSCLLSWLGCCVRFPAFVFL